MVKIILFILFALLTVRGDDFGSFFVVQMPEDEARGRSLQKFQVYWNVPTMQCKSKGIPFTDLYAKYGILQNKGDRFQGEHVTILYDPGRFPALLQNGSELVYRNGGVPQEGDIDLHLKAFQNSLESKVPETFRGLGIIDFESWRPIFRQNFGNLSPYKDVSYEVERRRHPLWPQSWVQDEAVRRFEEAGRQFMLSTLELARRLRPRGSWGYYGFPYCFNMSPSNKRQQCAARVPEENDKMSWLWQESTALYPSLYSPKNLNADQLQQLIRGRVLEAKRLRGRSRVLPYFWYKYRDGGFITAKDLQNSLATLYKSSAAGMVLWGSSNDVNTKAKCAVLLDYVENTLGPMIAKYTKTERLAREHSNSDRESGELVKKTEEGDISTQNESIENTETEEQSQGIVKKNIEARRIALDLQIKTEARQLIMERPDLKTESKQFVTEIAQVKTELRENATENSKSKIEFTLATKTPQTNTDSGYFITNHHDKRTESRGIVTEIPKETSKEFEKVIPQLKNKNVKIENQSFQIKSEVIENSTVKTKLEGPGKGDLQIKEDDNIQSKKKLNQDKTVNSDTPESQYSNVEKDVKDPYFEESEKESNPNTDSEETIRKTTEKPNKSTENRTTQTAVSTATAQVSSVYVIGALQVLWFFSFLLHHRNHLSL